jgi:uncharacterized protein with FMN-binding domain
MKKKKTLWIILGVIGLMIIVGSLFMAYTQDQLSKLSKTPIGTIDLNTIPNGTYTGAYASFPVSVTLEVTILDHEITKITILKHDNGQGKPAEAIAEDVIEAQSLQVDVISGATYSSKVILKALENALNP